MKRPTIGRRFRRVLVARDSADFVATYVIDAHENRVVVIHDEKGNFLARAYAACEEEGIVLKGVADTRKAAKKLRQVGLSGSWVGGKLVSVMTCNAPGFPIRLQP